MVFGMRRYCVFSEVQFVPIGARVESDNGKCEGAADKAEHSVP